MKTLKESVVTAMDGTSVDIFPFLPYILQDFWEIGASPLVIAALIEKHTSHFSDLRVLDLGCGKGAVSVFGWQSGLNAIVMVLMLLLNL